MIVVANEAQANTLNEISRLTEWIVEELGYISDDVANANKAIENGSSMVRVPDTARLAKHSAEREGLYKAAYFAGVAEEDLKLAATLTETGSRHYFTTK